MVRVTTQEGGQGVQQTNNQQSNLQSNQQQSSQSTSNSESNPNVKVIINNYPNATAGAVSGGGNGH
ncbi:MAG: hypothetical protein WAM14_02610 [Candidatus Nitrosopolaris sp.]